MDETLGVTFESSAQYPLTFAEHGLRATEVHLLRREPNQAAVVMLVVVPGEELAAVRERVLEAASEAIGKPWAVLQRLEVALAEGVVVGDVRAAQRFLDAQVREQLAERLAGHGSSAVGMQDELARRDVVFLTALAQQPPRQFSALAAGEHPADNVATEDVEHDVQVEVRPLLRSQQLRDVPRPNLVRGSRDQLRFLVIRMPQLIASLAHGVAGFQHS